MIVELDDRQPYGGIGVGACIARGYRVHVSCADHGAPRQLDLSRDGPFAPHAARTWPEVFPWLRCRCGKPAIRLTLGVQDQFNAWVALRIADAAHPFPRPGQKHVAEARDGAAPI